MVSIKQAVILCGGLGTRLRPITNFLPKPMVEINYKPFLWYLLNQLSNNGIKRFLLLTGYLSDSVSNYFGNGSKWGWEISYSEGLVSWETSRRIWEAKELIDDFFLLTYSDNYVEINLIELERKFIENRSVISLHLFEKENGNVSIIDDKLNVNYDPSRVSKDLNFVELGYMFIDKKRLYDNLKKIPHQPNISFSEVLKKVSKDKLLSGIIIKNQYYSISDPKRLEKTKEYFTTKKILLIDRDGTINYKAPRGEYITSWKDFIFIKESLSAMKILSNEGFKFVVITNQAGVSTGDISIKLLNSIHTKMINKLNSLDIDIAKIYFSTDHWSSNSFRRKPNPGMLIEASKDFVLKLDETFYIGDDERDCIAAKNAGCRSLLITNESKLSKCTPDYKGRTMMELVPLILDSFNNIFL